jgi:hypothetical protein
VKKNQHTLYAAIELYTALATPLSTYQYSDVGHGREVHRRVELFVNAAVTPKGWENIQRIEEVAYYSLSKPIDSAQEVAAAIQQHWGIENKLHWVKDVWLGEDAMTVRGQQGVALLVCLNNIALDLLLLAGLQLNKDTFAKINNKVEELAKVLNNKTKK